MRTRTAKTLATITAAIGLSSLLGLLFIIWGWAGIKVPIATEIAAFMAMIVPYGPIWFALALLGSTFSPIILFALLLMAKDYIPLPKAKGEKPPKPPMEDWHG